MSFGPTDRRFAHPQPLLESCVGRFLQRRRIAELRNAPRELDLDLLLFDEQTRNDPDFVLPHPRAVNRLFVLAPAAEVLPEATWPGVGLTIAELLAGVASDEQVQRLSHASVG